MEELSTNLEELKKNRLPKNYRLSDKDELKFTPFGYEISEDKEEKIKNNICSRLRAYDVSQTRFDPESKIKKIRLDNKGDYQIIGDSRSQNTFKALERLFGLKDQAKQKKIKDGDLNVKDNFPRINENSAYKITIPKKRFEDILSKIVNKGDDNENLLNYLKNTDTGVNFSEGIIEDFDINGDDLKIRLSNGRMADATRKHIQKLFNNKATEDNKNKIFTIKDYFANGENSNFLKEEEDDLFDNLKITATYKSEFLESLGKNKKDKGQQIFSDLIGSFVPEVAKSKGFGQKNWIDNDSGISEDGKSLIVYLDRGWHKETSDAISSIFNIQPNNDGFYDSHKTNFEIPIEKIITLQSLNKKLNQIADEPWRISTTYFSKEEKEMMEKWADDERIAILKKKESKIAKYREEMINTYGGKEDFEKNTKEKDYKGIGIQGGKFAIEEGFLKISNAKVYESSPLGGLLLAQGFSSSKSGFIEVGGDEIFIKIPEELEAEDDDSKITKIKEYIKDKGIEEDWAIMCKKNENSPLENVLLNQKELKPDLVTHPNNYEKLKNFFESENYEASENANNNRKKPKPLISQIKLSSTEKNQINQ